MTQPRLPTRFSQLPKRFLRRRPAPPLVVLAVVVLLIVVRLWPPDSQPHASPFDAEEVRVARVVDGDTLLLESRDRVRLIGVDTPETKRPNYPVERLGKEASRFTEELVGHGPVRLEFDRERRDQYRRLLAYVYLPDGRMLNEELIRAGLSEAETHFPFRSDRKRRFVAAEKEAKAKRLGLWATPATDKAVSP